MTKKLILLIFSIVAQTLFSQKYEFDHMMKIENTTTDPKTTYVSYNLIDSKDHSNYMVAVKNVNSGDFYSILIDEGKKIGHRFTIGKNFILPVKFIFEQSFDLSNKKFINYKDLKIEKIGHLHYEISTRKNELKIEIFLEPYEADLLVLEFEALTNEQRNAIENLIKRTLVADKATGNFEIKEITYKYFKDKKITQKISPEKIDVKIDL